MDDELKASLEVLKELRKKQKNLDLEQKELTLREVRDEFAGKIRYKHKYDRVNVMLYSQDWLKLKEIAEAFNSNEENQELGLKTNVSKVIRFVINDWLRQLHTRRVLTRIGANVSFADLGRPRRPRKSKKQ